MKKKILALVSVVILVSLVFTTVTGAVSINRSYLFQKDEEGNYQIKGDRTITMVNYPEKQSIEGWILLSNDYSLPVVVGEEVQVNTTGTVWYYSEENQNHIADVSGKDESFYISGSDVYISETTTAKISEGVSSENELLDVDEYSTVHVDYNEGQSVINTESIPVKYETTYFNIKLTNGNDTTIVKMKIEISAGDVETYAFQMNTDTSEGSVSEFNPSFRVINRSSMIVTKPNDATDNRQVYTVKDYGTIYTVDENITDSEMTFGSSNKNVNILPCNIGLLENWKYAKDNVSYYFAATFKSDTYYLDMLEMKHMVRAYAITEDGDYVLGKNICKTSIYDIAQLLYDNALMSTQKSHDYLYDNILNIVAIKNNYAFIGQAMLKALNITSKSSLEYNLVNNTYKDLYHYVRIDYKYVCDRYSQRGSFSPKTETMYNNVAYNTETVLLEKLNDASDSNYNSVADWIYNEAEKYGYAGFYKKKNFNNDSALVSTNLE